MKKRDSIWDRVKRITPEEAEKMVSSSCEYCIKAIVEAKKKKVKILYDVEDFHIIGYSL